MFNLLNLEDEETISYYQIKHLNVVHLIQEMVLLTPRRVSKHNHDFTAESDMGELYSRGGFSYKRPYGWMRYAIPVEGKYEDDVWLNGSLTRGNRFESALNEWAVSYCGNGYHNGLSISQRACQALSKNNITNHGGIYTTPKVDVAADYAIKFTMDGINYRAIVQNRVNPESLTEIPTSLNDQDFWHSPLENDIRPYGICVQEIQPSL